MVYEQLAHFVEVLAELHDRFNEERLAMGAVVDAVARFSDIPGIPVCNNKDLHLPLRWLGSPVGP